MLRPEKEKGRDAANVSTLKTDKLGSPDQFQTYSKLQQVSSLAAVHPLACRTSHDGGRL